MMDVGWELGDWEPIFGLPEDMIRTEISRQIEIIRSKS